MRSGRWQDALTIVSNGVRATATRKPRSSSWRARRRRDAGSASATRTSGSAIAAAADGIRGLSSSTVCNSDIGAPLVRSGATRSKNAAVLAAEEAIDPDRDERTGDDGDEVHVDSLAARIEGGKQHPPRQAPEQCGGGDFREHEHAPLR